MVLDKAMAKQESNKFLHWNYFLAIESDVAVLSRFVEFTNDNFTTYSLEMTHILIAAASEVDVVAKLLCKKVNPDVFPEKMNKYREVLNPALPTIKDMTVTIRRFGLTLTPWSYWRYNLTPQWWSDHNHVKHERNLNFKKANLKNTLNSMTGLFVLILHYYKYAAENAELVPDPSLFMVSNKFIVGIEIKEAQGRTRYQGISGPANDS